ncbi:MAG TPA: mercuric transporter MerT family protein [Pyrinomonadaceae bacterium]|nr:mercuric transporter MerT family protein [Pyrinomonadaceae bacterium]
MSKENVAVGGAVLTAIGASLCCIGPILTLIFGVGAFGAATIFASARPYLLVAAVLALAFGFYRLYLRREACAPGEACLTKPPSRTARFALWTASVAVLIFALSPYYVGTLARQLSAKREVAGAPQLVTARETFKVSGMTCAGCETTIKLALEQTPGVRSAEVSYERGEAVVEYDPTLTSTDKLRAAINETGYTCELPK